LRTPTFAGEEVAHLFRDFAFKGKSAQIQKRAVKSLVDSPLETSSGDSSSSGSTVGLFRLSGRESFHQEQEESTTTYLSPESPSSPV